MLNVGGCFVKPNLADGTAPPNAPVAYSKLFILQASLAESVYGQ